MDVKARGLAAALVHLFSFDLLVLGLVVHAGAQDTDLSMPGRRAFHLVVFKMLHLSSTELQVVVVRVVFRNSVCLSCC